MIRQHLDGHGCMFHLPSAVCRFLKSDIKHDRIPLEIEMALASGHWVEKETAGMPPRPRWDTLGFYLVTPNGQNKNWASTICLFTSRAGHALAVAGNLAFLHGGVLNMMNSTHEVCNNIIDASDVYMTNLVRFSFLFFCFQEPQAEWLNDFYMITGKHL